MDATHRKRLKVRLGHRIIQTDVQTHRAGDSKVVTYWYDEVDAKGRLVRQHRLNETMPIDAPGGEPSLGDLMSGHHASRHQKPSAT